MNITNNFNLPQTFINILHKPTYSKGASHISATELLNSPRIVQLKQKHWNDLEQDASEMVWQLFGTAIHNILEGGRDKHHIVEERISLDFHGWKLSGAIDLQEVFEDGIVINDYKVTSAWAVMNEKSDWKNQLNIYAWLVEKAKGAHVKSLNIIAIVRDWTSRETNRENYPQSPIVTISIPLWSFEEREAYVKKRLDAHNGAYFAMNTESELPLCSSEDMWEKPESFAVIKHGNKRATSVHPTREEAEEAIPDGKYYVAHRPGERTRCEKFCQVSKFCSQYQQYLQEQSDE